MRSKRYTEEFKIEAVRQVVERGTADLGKPITAKHGGRDVRIFCAALLEVLCLKRTVLVVGIGHPSCFGDKTEFSDVERRTHEFVMKYG